MLLVWRCQSNGREKQQQRRRLPLQNVPDMGGGPCSPSIVEPMSNLRA